MHSIKLIDPMCLSQDINVTVQSIYKDVNQRIQSKCQSQTCIFDTVCISLIYIKQTLTGFLYCTCVINMLSSEAVVYQTVRCMECLVVIKKSQIHVVFDKRQVVIDKRYRVVNISSLSNYELLCTPYKSLIVLRQMILKNTNYFTIAQIIPWIFYCINTYFVRQTYNVSDQLINCNVFHWQ